MPATPVIATLATSTAMDDLRVLLFTLQHWNPADPPIVYLYGDTEVAAAVPSLRYPRPIQCRAALDPYKGMGRAEMESIAGTTFPTLWFDFMAEKIALMEWALAEHPEGVYFLDADICLLGPLPPVPAAAMLALSPHAIRRRDEAKYGTFNGGFFWCREQALLDDWRRACHTSRFYEQAALEDMAEAAVVRANGDLNAVYYFPIQHNYGWWRLWQSEEGAEARMHAWTMNRHKAAGGCGVLVEGAPLGSVHTHWGERVDRATLQFNLWVLQWLQKLAGGHAPARKMNDFLLRTFPHLRSAAGTSL